MMGKTIRVHKSTNNLKQRVCSKYGHDDDNDTIKYGKLIFSDFCPFQYLLGSGNDTTGGQ